VEWSDARQGRSQPPQVGGAKLKKKFWSKILIFFFLGENLEAKPQGGSAPDARVGQFVFT